MSQQNFITVNIPEGDLTEIKAAIHVIREKLEPHLKSLSSKEKMELPKMGPKTLAFVQKSLEYCSQNSELVPSFLDVEEFTNDFKGVELLRELHQPLLQITESLDDSLTLVGSDAYQAALMYYTAVKGAKKANIPNAGTIYDDLSNRFPGKSLKKNTNNNE
jgi:hypothetical protein